MHFIDGPCVSLQLKQAVGGAYLTKNSDSNSFSASLPTKIDPGHRRVVAFGQFLFAACSFLVVSKKTENNILKK